MSESNRIRIVCTSDTHNEDPSKLVPDGDVFIHAGDMTNHGTFEELEKAYQWISNLPHKLKIVISGNHDSSLDPHHESHSEESLALFTSPSAREAGIVYLGPSSPFHTHADLLNIYANPSTPDFLKKGYGHTYPPHPAPEATAVWASAPETCNGPLDLWVTHGPPKDRLAVVGPFPFTLYLKGCEVQRQKVAAAKPLVCIFGHFHYSYGIERVTWREGPDVKPGDEVAQSTKVTGEGVHDFTGLKPGKETVFINTAWMTGLMTLTKKRNKPVAFDLEYAPPISNDA